MFSKHGSIQKDMDYSQKLLQEILSRHLGDNLVSSEAMDVFLERMAEFKRLSRAVLTSEQMLTHLNQKWNNCRSSSLISAQRLKNSSVFSGRLKKAGTSGSLQDSGRSIKRYITGK